MTLIDADKYFNLIVNAKSAMQCIEKLHSMPSVDAVPVVHGNWIKADLDNDYVTCSNCKKLNRNDRLAFIPDYAKGMHYCMICGALMDEVKHGDN